MILPDIQAMVEEDRGVANDCAELLGCLVRMLQPRRVIEAGTFPGRSTEAISAALPKGSKVYTYERVENLARVMFERFQTVENISTHHGPPPSFGDCELAFIDSGPSYEDRLYDILKWVNTAPPGSLCLVDDADEDWFRHLWIDSIILPTHTGLALLRQRKI